MIAILKGLQKKQSTLKVLEWTKVLSITGGTQIAIQAIGVISGIIIIRLLPTHEYALYTLGNTMLGMLTMLADGGISTGVMAEGGKVWQDRDRLGSVLVTGTSLRKRFALISFLLSAPVLLYLLLHNGASWLTAILILASILVAFVAAISSALLEVAPKLKQDIIPLQKNQLQANIGRLILIAVSVFVFPWAFIAIIGNGLPRMWANFRLLKISEQYVNWREQQDIAVKKSILTIVKRVLPGTIYMCISGQITIWLISFFGTVSAIASLGALSRLTMILGLLSVVFGTIFIPRFARLPLEQGLLLKRISQAFGVFLLVSIVFLVFVKIFANELLWILGDDYSMLQDELFLGSVGGCVGMLAGLSYHFSSCKGWILRPVVSIPVSIVCIVLGIFLFDISTVMGVLKFNLFIAGGEALKNGSYLLFKIRKLK